MFTNTQKNKLIQSFKKPLRLADFRLHAEQVMQNTKYKILQNFINSLLEENIIKSYEYATLNNKNIVLYASSDPNLISPYKLALALQPKAYFCNTTSIYFHKLTDQVPATVYICFETIQNKTRQKNIKLSDDKIRKAFLGNHRLTKNVYKLEKLTLTIVDRLQGTRFGLKEIANDKGLLPKGAYVTNLERALIDAIVSPQYNGGIANVYNCFKAAKTKINITRLIDIYNNMRFIYPYSQTIGFFLESIGLIKQSEILRKTFPAERIFYADHTAKSTWCYHNKWKIYYPNNLINEN